MDDRRRFVGDLFPTPGDVNVVELQPGVTIAWHRHQHQTDYLYCIQGVVRVGVIDPQDVIHWTVLNEKDAAVYLIPPNHWHGYKCLGPERAIVLGYIDHKYDPEDEERRSIEEMGVSWATIER